MFSDYPIADNWGLGGPFHLAPELVLWLDGEAGPPQADLERLERWLREAYASASEPAELEYLETLWHDFQELDELDAEPLWELLQSLGQTIWSNRSPKSAQGMLRRTRDLISQEECVQEWIQRLQELGEEAAEVGSEEAALAQWKSTLEGNPLDPRLDELAPTVDFLVKVARAEQSYFEGGHDAYRIPWLGAEFEALEECYEPQQGDLLKQELLERWRWAGPGLILPMETRQERLQAVQRALQEEGDFAQLCSHLSELFSAIEQEVLRPEQLEGSWLVAYEICMGLLLGTQPEVAVEDCASRLPPEALAAIEDFYLEGEAKLLLSLFPAQSAQKLAPWWCPFCHRHNRLEQDRCGGCAMTCASDLAPQKRRVFVAPKALVMTAKGQNLRSV